MRYIDATASITRDLEHDGSLDAVRAGLRLMVMAWRELGHTDPAWDRFGLEVLAAEELLRDLPIAATACDPPAPGDPEVRSGLAVLLAAVANRLALASRDATDTVAHRLACDAAAGILQRAVGLLP
jgi:hypothetical protein